MKQTILVADDVDSARGLIKVILEVAGYQVLEASDGLEALQVSEAYTGPIHLLISDVFQPGLNGRDLIEEMLYQRPEMKALLISGNDYLAKVLLGLGERPFMAKPFRQQQLLDKVEELLGTPATVD